MRIGAAATAIAVDTASAPGRPLPVRSSGLGVGAAISGAYAPRYYAPPAYYAPPPVYYAPPPAYYGYPGYYR